MKILGVLRDALRQKSIGIIEENPAKGIVKYAKPAGVIASLVPTTNPELTPPYTGIYALKCLDAVIFSPHPRSKGTTFEMVRVMRDSILSARARPPICSSAFQNPSIPLTQYLMANCDLTLATGGQPMVRAAYSSGRPAYGVGAGNSTMVIDETADIDIAARNTRMSKTSDFGSGCSADGNLLIDVAHLRRAGRRARQGRRISREQVAGATRSRKSCGTSTATGCRKRSPVRRRRSRKLPASRFRSIASSSSSRTTRSARSTTTRARS